MDIRHQANTATAQRFPKTRCAMTMSVTTIRQNREIREPEIIPAETHERAARSSEAAPSRLFAAAALIALVALSALPARAADKHHTVVAAEDVTWGPGPPTLPSGAQLAVLFGSPAEEGPFVIRLKFPAGYDVPPHWHSKDEHVTVIAGAFGMGAGEALDRDAAPLLAAGSFVGIPARMPHYAWTDQETVVQINGMGPFDINYVNPKDDPRTN
jgi:quercetin dioxygenase-like cupin family protein